LKNYHTIISNTLFYMLRKKVAAVFIFYETEEQHSEVCRVTANIIQYSSRNEVWYKTASRL